MSLLPERVSVKRRRQEEPVDTLYLEHGTAPDKKRRVTDFYFQRLRDEVIAPVSLREKPAPTPKSPQSPYPGIPAVRQTSPGDDKREYERLKASLKRKEDTEAPASAREEEKPQVSSRPLDGGSQSAPSTPVSTEVLQRARRFHLARHLSSVLSPNSSGGIRKQKNSIRPPIATFVERQGATFTHEHNPMYSDKPADKVLDVPEGDRKADVVDSSGAQAPSLETLQAANRIPTSTFLQTAATSVRNGTSIRDHPSTWNYDSDQLADELAALAMELDPDVQPKPETEKPPASLPEPKDTVMSSRDHEDDYVYETYIRVRYDDETHQPLHLADNVGVLVIEEGDEDLWQKYVDSDDDTDWDEEDSNAEDNPSNDYPDEEVSSDDEYGYNPYKYRHTRSDDEAFDEDDDNLG